MSAWCGPGDPPAGAGPRSVGRAPGGPGRRGRCRGPGGSSLCPWPCALVRFAALFLVLLLAVVGVLLLLVGAGADRRRAPGGRGRLGRAGRWQRAGRAGGPRPGRFHLAPGLLSARWCPAAAPPSAGRVILRQVPGLDPAAGLLVVVVAVVVVAAVPVLVFSSLPVSLCPGPVRCAVPGLAAGCCRRGPAAGRRPCGSLAGAWSNLIRYTVTSGLGPAAPFLPLGAWSSRSWW